MRSIDSELPSKSKYMRKEEVGEQGRDLTIKDFVRETVKNDDGEDSKLVVYWTNPEYKPLILNKENGSRLKMVLKTDDLDLMVGRVVNVYNDKFVAFGGKVVGGCRIRSPQQAANAPAARQTRASAPRDEGPPSPPIEAYREDEGSLDVPF